ncbi:MAG: hypothetical protein DHS20C01_37700 [marine bacterium B5-7]|nr:MAG: hypothetical protein DHS20C01_37700 [marine bacterium B5-7]
MSWICRDFLQGLARTLEEKIETQFLVGTHHLAQSVWDGERDHAVRHREQSRLLFLRPIKRILIATEWATAMVATVRSEMRLPAVLA